MTNGDKVRRMEDEDLSKKVLAGQCACCIYQITGCSSDPQDCFDGVLQWLKQEIVEDDKRRCD